MYALSIFVPNSYCKSMVEAFSMEFTLTVFIPVSVETSDSIFFDTSSSISAGDAPGYIVDTTIIGKLISGLSSIGAFITERNPKNKTVITARIRVTGLFNENLVNPIINPPTYFLHFLILHCLQSHLHCFLPPHFERAVPPLRHRVHCSM